MYSELLERLGVPVQLDLLELALTHSSYAYENNLESNERLEFLGDSVLGFLVAEAVFSSHPGLQEGDLTRLKNSIVSAEALATVANRLELGQYLRLGKGEEASGGRMRRNILADSMEAVIAASYLTLGLEAARYVLQKHFLPMLGDHLALREFADPKTTLVERLNQRMQQAPRFEVSFSGLEHNRTYMAQCFSGSILLGEGYGRTIRTAETAAAAHALASLGRI